jgi:hypothetical protein
MDAITLAERSAGRQYTPRSISALPASTSEPILPLWTEKDAAYLTMAKSEDELLELYAEEWFVTDQFPAEDDVEKLDVVDKFKGLDRIVLGEQRGFVTHEVAPQAMSAPVHEEQQPYRPFKKDYTLLFDIAIPEKTNVELALLTLFDPDELPALFMCPVKQQLQPTIAGPLRDTVSQMLDFDVCNIEAQETACEYAPKREGRSLMRSQPACTFLPGLEHLTNIESRSAFVTYDSDFQVLQQATAEFVANRHDGECTCLDDKVSIVLMPGDNFLLAENDTALGLSVENPTAASLLDQIDAVVDDELLEESPCLGAFFNAAQQQYTTFTALDQLLQYPQHVSSIICAQSDAADDVSDMSEEDIDELRMVQASELHYFDADKQQHVTYTAFNQLLMDPDEDTVSRIHRMDDVFDDDPDLEAVLLEIGEPPSNDEAAECEVVSPPASAFEDFGFELEVLQNQPELNTNNLMQFQSIDSLQSFWRSKSVKRPKLTVVTQLETITEVPSDGDVGSASCSTPSSDASIDFADHRGFVQALPTRRADFLDDEDSGDELEGPQSVSCPVDSDELFLSVPTSSSDLVEDFYEVFSDAIWHCEPDLYLSFPVNGPAESTDHFPHPDLLEEFEIEINVLIAFIFECINDGRSDQLPTLGSDLHWALGALAGEYLGFALVERLGAAVEILLERTAASGSN